MIKYPNEHKGMDLKNYEEFEIYYTMLPHALHSQVHNYLM